MQALCNWNCSRDMTVGLLRRALKWQQGKTGLYNLPKILLEN